MIEHTHNFLDLMLGYDNAGWHSHNSEFKALSFMLSFQKEKEAVEEDQDIALSCQGLSLRLFL